LTAQALLFTPQGALRAPWRIVTFLIATLACGVVGYILLTVVGTALGPLVLGFDWDPWLALFAVLGATVVTLRAVDRRPWSDLWLGGAAARAHYFVEGWLLGAGAIALASVLLLAAGWLAVEPNRPGSWSRAALRVSAMLLAAALAEELFFRGYLLAVLRQALGWAPALFFTSVAFSLAHAENLGAAPQPLALVGLAGLFLGGIVLVTRSLYAAWMAHFAWNWVMAVLMHSRVSGLGSAAPHYRTVDAGPDWATGGVWGPEGGGAAAVGMAAGLAYLVARRRRVGTV